MQLLSLYRKIQNNLILKSLQLWSLNKKEQENKQHRQSMLSSRGCRTRTDDLTLPRRALYQTEPNPVMVRGPILAGRLYNLKFPGFIYSTASRFRPTSVPGGGIMLMSGLEPLTFRLSAECSNLLSYISELP